MNVLYFLTILSLIIFAQCAIFRTTFTGYLTTDDRDKFYKTLISNTRILNRKKIHPSPYRFDKFCAAVHKTNHYFSTGCELPSNCSKSTTITLNESFYGAETLFCYSFFNSNMNEAEIAQIEHDSFHMLSRNSVPLADKQYTTTLIDIKPISFFENFYYYSVGGKVAIIPKLCAENYKDQTYHEDSIPNNLQILENHESVCFTQFKLDEHDCEPLLFNTLYELYKFYDFPITYQNVPFDKGSYLGTCNSEISALDLSGPNYKNLMNNVKPKHVFRAVSQERKQHYYVSFANYQTSKKYHIICIETYKIKSFSETNCIKISESYKNPIPALITAAIAEVKKELVLFFRVFIESVEVIASFLLKIFLKVLELILELIPFSEVVLTALFVALIFYLSNNDIIFSIIGFSASLFLQILFKCSDFQMC